MREELLGYLCELLYDKWVSASVFGFSTKDSTVRPAVIVLIKPGTMHNWKDLTSQMSHILRGSPDITVEFLPGQVSNLSGRWFANGFNKLQSTSKMGCSIGEIGQHGAGTLGGFVTLKGNGLDHQGFLTSHHVVRPYSSASHVIQTVDKLGYGTSSPNTAVQYPATDDLAATVRAINRKVVAIQKQITDLEKKAKGFGFKGQPVPESIQDTLAYQKGNLVDLQSQKSQLEQLPMTLARVLFSSGDCVSASGSILD